MSETKSETKAVKKHRIVLIENAGNAFAEVKEMLTASQESFMVETAFVTFSEYFEYLEQKKSIPPAFIICFTDPENSYKKLFIKVKEKFPETRRMLIVESNERDKIIESLNNDEIHFCLALPFKDSDLLEQIKFGLQEVEQGSTWEYTKRIVDEQNVKMYKIAKSFKEKEEKYLKIINQKEDEYKGLKADLAKSHDATFVSSSLAEYIALKNISLLADEFGIEFKALAEIIATAFDKIASKNSVDFQKGEYSDILSTKDQPLSDNKDKAKMINYLLGYAFTNSNSDSTLDSNETPESGEDVGMTEMTRDTKQAEQVDSEMSEIDPDDVMAQLEQVLEFTIDDKRLSAQVKIIDKYSELLTAENIFEYLREIGVSYGLTNEQTLLTWLDSKGSVGQLIVAKGTAPVQPVDGIVKYHFDADFIHAGKVKSDGSMDFRERGDIPFVEENTLLAEKTPAKFGTPGVDISGAQIPVDDPVDPVFEAGDNTFESEGGMKIFAKTGGQPHLDAMGTVSVAQILNIDSDVDYETGNISFKGSIVVNGAIKEGFKVEGTNLTAEQIEGAEVNITGDLNVSAGIIDS
ncbi:MAG: DUF342 domain-containing protein, partial [Desulfobacteraceae bacterium]|nr:DUF342 domain-containing protein [Desulfobacteraceae bacterium]